MSTIMHLCISINGVLNHTDAQLKRDHCKWITREGKVMTPTELRTELCRWAARGFDAIPTCDHYDKRGHCKGHPSEGGAA